MQMTKSSYKLQSERVPLPFSATGRVTGSGTAILGSRSKEMFVEASGKTRWLRHPLGGVAAEPLEHASPAAAFSRTLGKGSAETDSQPGALQKVGPQQVLLKLTASGRCGTVTSTRLLEGRGL